MSSFEEELMMILKECKLSLLLGICTFNKIIGIKRKYCIDKQRVAEAIDKELWQLDCRGKDAKDSIEREVYAYAIMELKDLKKVLGIGAEEKGVPQCPECGSQDLVSHPEHGIDDAYYCRACHADFYKKEVKR